MKLYNRIVLYIFNEKYWFNSLVYTQNILPLLSLSKKSEVGSYQIIAYTPILNLIINRREISNFKIMISDKNIKLINRPIFFIMSRFFHIRLIMMPFFVLNLLPYTIFDIFQFAKSNKNKTILHFRSYPISILSFIFKGNKCRMIFDPRSDYIKENTFVGTWKDNSFSQKIWFWLEKKIIHNTNKTISISNAMKSDLVERTDSKNYKKITIIPNCADYNHFSNQRIKKNDFTMIYSGSLGSWNKLDIYINFFEGVLNHRPDAKLIIASSQSKSKILRKELINPKTQHLLNNITFVQASYNDLPNVYSRCSFGLQLMSRRDNRIGVKYVEYLASGLIPIVNSAVEGAYEYSTKYNFGIAIHSKLNEIDYQSLVENMEEKLSTNINESLGQELFDIHSNSKLLKYLYLNV